jgi:hypothetical protein
MTREIDWEDWKRYRRSLVATEGAHAERLARARRAGGGAKPSDPESDRLLAQWIRDEWARRKAEGRIVQIGPREYELHPRRR